MRIRFATARAASEIMVGAEECADGGAVRSGPSRFDCWSGTRYQSNGASGGRSDSCGLAIQSPRVEGDAYSARAYFGREQAASAPTELESRGKAAARMWGVIHQRVAVQITKWGHRLLSNEDGARPGWVAGRCLNGRYVAS